MQNLCHAFQLPGLSLRPHLGDSARPSQLFSQPPYPGDWTGVQVLTYAYFTPYV